MVAALVVLIVLSVLFAVVGTQTFWRQRLTWGGWNTLYVLVAMLAALVLDMWDVSLTFFVTNTALLLARIISLNDALAGFSNEGVLWTAIMFIIARAIEKTKVLEWVVRVVLRRPAICEECTYSNASCSGFLVFLDEQHADCRSDDPSAGNMEHPREHSRFSFVDAHGIRCNCRRARNNYRDLNKFGDTGTCWLDESWLFSGRSFRGSVFLLDHHFPHHGWSLFCCRNQQAPKIRSKQFYAWHRVPPKSPLIGTLLKQSAIVKVPGVEMLCV
jgi:hypothetical protein